MSMIRTLRARFVLGVAAMLLPLALLGGGAFLSLQHMTATFNEAVDDPMQELHAFTLLQSRVLITVMPLHDYLINGENTEREKFSRLRAETDRSFEEILAAATLWPEQKALLQAAQSEWLQAKQSADTLLALGTPQANPAATEEMKRMDSHVDRLVEILGRAQDLTRDELDAEMKRVHAIQRWALLLIVGGGGTLGLIIAAISGLFLARSVLAPLRVLESGARRIGAGEHAHRISVKTGDELEQLAETFNAMAEALEKDRARLEELSTHDGLTGLYNHRSFYTLLEEEIARCRRFGRSMALLMLDIDHFKRVNDTHGHQAGDAILRGLSERLLGQARTVDRVCRYGGEEIALILPDTAAALDVAERLRASVEALPFECGNGSKSLAITVSIGVAYFPAHANTAAELVAAADAALYAAKEGGRNRVCVSGHVQDV